MDKQSKIDLNCPILDILIINLDRYKAGDSKGGHMNQVLSHLQ